MHKSQLEISCLQFIDFLRVNAYLRFSNAVLDGGVMFSVVGEVTMEAVMIYRRVGS